MHRPFDNFSGVLTSVLMKEGISSLPKVPHSNNKNTDTILQEGADHIPKKYPEGCSILIVQIDFQWPQTPSMNGFRAFPKKWEIDSVPIHTAGRMDQSWYHGSGWFLVGACTSISFFQKGWWELIKGMFPPKLWEDTDGEVISRANRKFTIPWVVPNQAIGGSPCTKGNVKYELCILPVEQISNKRAVPIWLIACKEFLDFQIRVTHSRPYVLPLQSNDPWIH